MGSVWLDLTWMVAVKESSDHKDGHNDETNGYDSGTDAIDDVEPV